MFYKGSLLSQIIICIFLKKLFIWKYLETNMKL